VFNPKLSLCLHIKGCKPNFSYGMQMMCHLTYNRSIYYKVNNQCPLIGFEIKIKVESIYAHFFIADNLHYVNYVCDASSVKWP
jgi:hypothetical protein